MILCFDTIQNAVTWTVRVSIFLVFSFAQSVACLSDLINLQPGFAIFRHS